jgi:hypothetical protein
MKKIFFPIFVILFIACDNNNSNQETLTSTIEEVSPENEASKWDGKLNELLTLQIASTVSGYNSEEARADYNQILKKPSTHSIAYRWEKGRSKSVHIPITGKKMEIPTDDFVKLSWVQNTTLEKFKANYHTPTKEELSNANKAMESKLKEMQADNKITSEQSDLAKDMASNFASDLSFDEVSSVGDYAVWNNKMKELKVFYKGLEFQIKAEFGNDESINRQKSIEAAKLIIKEKL